VRRLCTGRGLTALADTDSGGVDQQFGPDPAVDAWAAADPGGQAVQTAGKAGAVGEVAFDLAAVPEHLRARAGALPSTAAPGGVAGESGPRASSQVLRDGTDFGCGDTIVFTCDHSAAIVDFDISVAVEKGQLAEP
jgi:hypothetical protein